MAEDRVLGSQMFKEGRDQLCQCCQETEKGKAGDSVSVTHHVGIFVICLNRLRN